MTFIDFNVIQKPPHHHLGLVILPPDAAHIKTAGFCVVYIGHGSKVMRPGEIQMIPGSNSKNKVLRIDVALQFHTTGVTINTNSRISFADPPAGG